MATNNVLKRQAIFDKYSANLDLLISSGLLSGVIKKYDKTYVCPICLTHFSEADLDVALNNHLTLEDAPPVSLGGRADTLTCKSCNNGCGTGIDKHLVERMREMDREQFLPGAVFEAWFKMGALKVKGLISVMKDGRHKVKFDLKHNNPKILRQFLEHVDSQKAIGDAILNPTLPESKVDVRKLQLALLKSGYMLIFSKFGYSFILDSAYDRIREQLLNPNKDIYPTNFWFHHFSLKEIPDVPFIIEPGLESIMPTFSLSTNISLRVFYTILPLTTKPIELVIDELQKKFAAQKTLDIEMYGFSNQVDYLSDIDAIKYMVAWINRVK
jgi:hypothetical protein